MRRRQPPSGKPFCRTFSVKGIGKLDPKETPARNPGIHLHKNEASLPA